MFCEFCGSRFTPFRRGGHPKRFCSAECRVKNRTHTRYPCRVEGCHRLSWDARDICETHRFRLKKGYPIDGPPAKPPPAKPPKRCESCEREFVPDRGRRFCSRPCIPPRRPNWHGICETCGASFVSFRRRRACSRYCSDRIYKPNKGPIEHTCGVCSAPFLSICPHAVYCSKTCSRRNFNRHKHERDGRKKRGPDFRRSLARRYGWNCYLCHRPTNPDIRWPHPLSASTDHVVPLSAGGKDDRTNIRLAHWHCNEEKGDQLLGIEFGGPLAA
jgi:hypothetical protein